jgi:hypothetical protein
LSQAKIESWVGRDGTGTAKKALAQKSKTITPPTNVPVNSINQSKGISPNGRLWAKHASITLIPHFPRFVK